MKHYISWQALGAVILSGAVALGCSDETDEMMSGADAGAAVEMDASAAPDGGQQVDAGMIDGGPPPSKTFQVRVENHSHTSMLPTALSSVFWATHSEGTPLFAEGEVDRGEGLQALAEDGDGSAIASAAENIPGISSSGYQTTSTGTVANGTESMAGAALPGQAFEFTVTTNALSPYLSFATMVAESNDLFLSPSSGGLKLFGDDGMPIASTELTADIGLWDLGTEANEAPGSGLNQGARQTNPGDGNPEGVVHLFNYSTRSLPLAVDLVEVSVTKISDDTLRFTVTNTSQDKGALTTSLTPVFWATHSDAWSLFTEGMPASAGLRRLARDAALDDLVMEHSSAAGVGLAQAESDKAGPGESYSFEVSTSMQQSKLSFAFALTECNDVFLALPSEGIKLISEQGNLRTAEELTAEINRRLTVWDAGAERNEPPGIGPTQIARQTAADRGSPDARAEVRRYQDAVNDLEGPRAGGIVNLTIEGDFTGEFTITLENTSNSSNFPTRFSSLVWMLHDGGTKLFADGSPASPQLESLAEDGNPDGLKGELNAMPNVTAEIVRTPDGAMGIGLDPGQRFVWTLTPSISSRTFNFATMIQSSNDSFLALGPQGIELLDANGQPKSNMEITNEILAKLQVWDAGTEGNQSGGGGPDQGTNQSAPGRGPAEGNQLIRKYGNGVWSYPLVEDLVRVTVTPLD